MCEGAARIHMQKHGTKSYDTPENTPTTPQIIWIVSLSRPRNYDSLFESEVKKKKSYFWIKSILNMLKFAYNYFSQIPSWKYQEYI